MPGRGYRFSVEVNERPDVHAAEFADDVPSRNRDTADAGGREWATSGSLALHEVPKLDPCLLVLVAPCTWGFFAV